jgi:hypothetical protein
MHGVEIRVKGQIDEQWSDWFGGLAIRHAEPDETVLVGALHGLRPRLRDLGLALVSVRPTEDDP